MTSLEQIDTLHLEHVTGGAGFSDGAKVETKMLGFSGFGHQIVDEKRNIVCYGLSGGANGGAAISCMPITLPARQQ